jgi:SAM-dependent methyltransferase
MTTPQSLGLRDAWSRALPDEVQYWQDVIRTRGLAWPQQFNEQLSPDTPLQPYLLRRLPAPTGEGGTARILDVGSGPMTTIGKVSEGRCIELVAVDPLAEQYAAALRAEGLTPPVPTIAGDAERLDALFPPSSFDLVHAKNSLDHTYNPVAALRQMVRVARPGCWVQLEHATNEAVRQAYTGLHQWNLCLDDGRFVLWRPGARADVQLQLDDLIDQIDITTPGGDWLSVGLRKRPARTR